MSPAPARWFIAQFECKRVSAFVSKRRSVFIRIYDPALLIEVFGGYVKRLMDVTDVMSKQDKRDWLGDSSFVLFRHLSLQNLNAERNHMDDVPFAATDGALAVSLRRLDRNVGVMEPMM
jgi:hypothetical protein